MPRLDDEIHALELALARNPRDAEALRRLSGLLQQKGERGAAAGCLMKLAHLYDDQGVLLKAISALKQAARLEPHRLDIVQDLAVHCVHAGLVPQALGYLEQLVDAHQRREDARSLVDALQRIRAIQPGWRPRHRV